MNESMLVLTKTFEELEVSGSMLVLALSSSFY
jgi:hypothetical protein